MHGRSLAEKRGPTRTATIGLSLGVILRLPRNRNAARLGIGAQFAGRIRPRAANPERLADVRFVEERGRARSEPGLARLALEGDRLRPRQPGGRRDGQVALGLPVVERSVLSRSDGRAVRGRQVSRMNMFRENRGAQDITPATRHAPPSPPPRSSPPCRHGLHVFQSRSSWSRSSSRGFLIFSFTSATDPK